MFHVTRRLLLRPAWPEDAEAIFAGIGEKAVVCNLARAPWPYTLESAREFLSRAHVDALPRFLVTMPTARGPDIVGMVGLHRRDDEIELGYWIARRCWGRGIASEAVGGLIAVARALGLSLLTAGHFRDNPASGRVLAKNGFIPTGEIRPQFSFARGSEVPSMRYELRLDGDDGVPDWQAAA